MNHLRLASVSNAVIILYFAWILPTSFGFLVQVQQKIASGIFPCRSDDYNNCMWAVSDPTSASPTDKKPLPPGRPTIRFLNILFDDTTRLLNPRDMKLLKRKEQFGSIFKTNFLFTPTVFVTDNTSIQELAKEEATKKLNAFFPPHHQKLYGRNSLLVQSGPTHTRIRKLVMNSMTPAMISSYDPIVTKAIHSFFQEQKEAASTDSREMLGNMRTLFMSVILQVVLGTTDVSPRLIQDMEMWSKGLLAPPLTFLPWSTAGKAMKARARIVQQLSDLMGSARDAGAISSTGTGLLAKLQQARDPDSNASLSQDEILDNLFTLVFAGSDTTSSAAVSIWIVLSQNPQLKEELKNATSDQLEAFVQGILEAFPPAPFNMRTTTEELEVGGYRVPVKWQVAYGFAAALDGSPVPNELVSTSATTSPASSSLSFGQGPRKCPGRYLATLELKLFARALVRQEWELDPKQNLEQTYTPGFFPVDRLKVKFI